MADKSLIFKNAKKILIPLPLDFNLWKPKNKFLSKKIKYSKKQKSIIIYLKSQIFI